MDLSDISDNDTDEEKLTIDEDTARTSVDPPPNPVCSVHINVSKTDPVAGPSKSYHSNGTGTTNTSQCSSNSSSSTSLGTAESDGSSSENEFDGDTDCGTDGDSQGSSSESSIDEIISTNQSSNNRRILLSSSDDNDDANDDKQCYICLNKFRSQDIGTPDSCDHAFCLECIQTWSKRVNTCPIDRSVFHIILARRCHSNTVYRKIQVDDAWVDESNEDLTYCRVCLRPDREHRMLLCDSCDSGYHCECLTPPLEEIPTHEWFCPLCIQTMAARENHQQEQSHGGLENVDNLHDEPSDSDTSYTSSNADDPISRQIPRTRLFERVRADINQSRMSRTAENIPVSSIPLPSEAIEAVPQTGFLAVTDDTIEAVPRSTSTSTLTRTPRSSSTQVTRTSGQKRKSTSNKDNTSANKRQKTNTSRKRRKVKRKSRKGKGKGKKTKNKTRRRQNRNARRAALTAPVPTPKSRIANHLGLLPPRAGTTIPRQRVANERTLDIQRSNVGIDALSIQGSSHDLPPIVPQPSMSGPIQITASSSIPARYSQLSLFSRRPLTKPVPSSQPCHKSHSSDSGDLLGSILQQQDKLALNPRYLRINRDGSLTTTETGSTKLQKSNKIDQHLKNPKLQAQQDKTLDTFTEFGNKLENSVNNGTETKVPKCVDDHDISRNDNLLHKDDVQNILDDDFKQLTSNNDDTAASDLAFGEKQRQINNGFIEEKTTDSELEDYQDKQLSCGDDMINSFNKLIEGEKGLRDDEVSEETVKELAEKPSDELNFSIESGESGLGESALANSDDCSLGIKQFNREISSDANADSGIDVVESGMTDSKDEIVDEDGEILNDKNTDSENLSEIDIGDAEKILSEIDRSLLAEMSIEKIKDCRKAIRRNYRNRNVLAQSIAPQQMKRLVKVANKVNNKLEVKAKSATEENGSFKVTINNKNKPDGNGKNVVSEIVKVINASEQKKVLEKDLLKEKISLEELEKQRDLLKKDLMLNVQQDLEEFIDENLKRVSEREVRKKNEIEKDKVSVNNENADATSESEIKEERTITVKSTTVKLRSYCDNLDIDRDLDNTGAESDIDDLGMEHRWSNDSGDYEDYHDINDDFETNDKTYKQFTEPVDKYNNDFMKTQYRPKYEHEMYWRMKEQGLLPYHRTDGMDCISPFGSPSYEYDAYMYRDYVDNETVDDYKAFMRDQCFRPQHPITHDAIVMPVTRIDMFADSPSDSKNDAHERKPEKVSKSPRAMKASEPSRSKSREKLEKKKKKREDRRKSSISEHKDNDIEREHRNKRDKSRDKDKERRKSRDDRSEEKRRKVSDEDPKRRKHREEDDRRSRNISGDRSSDYRRSRYTDNREYDRDRRLSGDRRKRLSRDEDYDHRAKEVDEYERKSRDRSDSRQHKSRGSRDRMGSVERKNLSKEATQDRHHKKRKVENDKDRKKKQVQEYDDVEQGRRVEKKARSRSIEKKRRSSMEHDTVEECPKLDKAETFEDIRVKGVSPIVSSDSEEWIVHGDKDKKRKPVQTNQLVAEYVSPSTSEERPKKVKRHNKLEKINLKDKKKKKKEKIKEHKKHKIKHEEGKNANDDNEVIFSPIYKDKDIEERLKSDELCELHKKIEKIRDSVSIVDSGINNNENNERDGTPENEAQVELKPDTIQDKVSRPDSPSYYMTNVKHFKHDLDHPADSFAEILKTSESKTSKSSEADTPNDLMNSPKLPAFRSTSPDGSLPYTTETNNSLVTTTGCKISIAEEDMYDPSNPTDFYSPSQLSSLAGTPIAEHEELKDSPSSPTSDFDNKSNLDNINQIQASPVYNSPEPKMNALQIKLGVIPVSSVQSPVTSSPVISRPIKDIMSENMAVRFPFSSSHPLLPPSHIPLPPTNLTSAIPPNATTLLNQPHAPLELSAPPNVTALRPPIHIQFPPNLNVPPPNIRLPPSNLIQLSEIPHLPPTSISNNINLRPVVLNNDHVHPLFQKNRVNNPLNICFPPPRIIRPNIPLPPVDLPHSQTAIITAPRRLVIDENFVPSQQIMPNLEDIPTPPPEVPEKDISVREPSTPENLPPEKSPFTTKHMKDSSRLSLSNNSMKDIELHPNLRQLRDAIINPLKLEPKKGSNELEHIHKILQLPENRSEESLQSLDEKDESDSPQKETALDKKIREVLQEHHAISIYTNQNMINEKESKTGMQDMDVSSPAKDTEIIIFPKKRKEKDVSPVDPKLQKEMDAIPSSAVDLTNKKKADKYIQKLHVQERVIEEVKVAIKPYFTNKTITKLEYKDIMRRAVPKIVHSRKGDINPTKIKELIDAYVEKAAKARVKLADDMEKELSSSIKFTKHKKRR